MKSKSTNGKSHTLKRLKIFLEDLSCWKALYRKAAREMFWQTECKTISTRDFIGGFLFFVVCPESVYNAKAALMWNAGRKKFVCLTKLLEVGTAVAKVDNNGTSAMQFAEDEQIAEMLQEYTASKS